MSFSITNTLDLRFKQLRTVFLKSMEYKYSDIAGMIDHALLNPTLSENELVKGCTLAETYQTATVCVKPCDVRRATKLLENSKTGICTVIGFPHGANLTEIKVLETQKACQEGASEVDMVINLGRAMSGDWKFVEEEVRTVRQIAHSQNAKLKVIIENDYLNFGGAGLDGNAFKRLLCKISENAGADWVKTSTGFGYTKQPEGNMISRGATVEDVSLMVECCSTGMQVKAAGGVKDLSTLLQMRKIGATRIGTSSTQSILEECLKSLGLSPLSDKHENSTSTY